MIYYPSFGGICKAAYQRAKRQKKQPTGQPTPHFLKLLRSKIDAAFVVYQNGGVADFEQVLADIVILTMTLAGYCQINLEDAVLRRLEQQDQ